MWHWLVAHGLYGAVVSWLVFFMLGTVMLGGFRKTYKRLVNNQQAIAQQQAVIADRLDTASPGGLKSVVDAIDSLKASVPPSSGRGTLSPEANPERDQGGPA